MHIFRHITYLIAIEGGKEEGERGAEGKRRKRREGKRKRREKGGK